MPPVRQRVLPVRVTHRNTYVPDSIASLRRPMFACCWRKLDAAPSCGNMRNAWVTWTRIGPLTTHVFLPGLRLAMLAPYLPGLRTAPQCWRGEGLVQSFLFKRKDGGCNCFAARSAARGMRRGWKFG